ncbi:MAG: DUF2889 domain-containing protein [Limnobacter sp.]|nr:DUF2889 domain-containing protein [Limnobacter sp.]
MSLPAPSARRHLHTRRVHCEGFLRDDGLWDIEGRIVDTKTYTYTEPFRGVREPGSEVHDMAVRLTIDDAMVVHAIAVDMPSVPYPTCPGAKPNFQGLVGACIARGWRRSVNEAVGGTQGCTHVRELLFPMATVAFQTVNGWAEDGPDGVCKSTLSENERPIFIDGCHSWAADGEVVATLYPRFSTRAAATGTDESDSD